MDRQRNGIENCLDILTSLSHVDPATLLQFRNRLTKDNNLIRDTNPKSHFCTFFIPLDPVKRKVFLIDHIKGRDWMAPGGHLDAGENPRDAVVREMSEELRFAADPNAIKLVDVSIKHIDNSKIPCRVHYDFSYVVEVPEQEFSVDPSEFNGYGWFTFEEGVKKIQTPEFKESLVRIIALYS
jgi:8-oxo-dGTP pyrophosphatase MutT (NUDIX family)